MKVRLRLGVNQIKEFDSEKMPMVLVVSNEEKDLLTLEEGNKFLVHPEDMTREHAMFMMKEDDEC